VSTDAPTTRSDKPVRDDHAPPAEPDRTRPVEQTAGRQQADAGRPQQPAQTLNRADYNRARHEAPPIQRDGDSGSRAQSDAGTRSFGSDGDRRTEHSRIRHTADGSASERPRAEALNRAEFNSARHAAPPIDRGGSPRDQAERSQDGQRPERASPERPAAEDAARPAGPDARLKPETALGDKREADSGAGELAPGAGGRPRADFSWVSLGEGDRTLGDTSPTGIGLKPTGEQLLETDSKKSRAEAFREEFYKPETIEDFRDESEDKADRVQQLFERPPTSGHADVPVPHSYITVPEAEHVSANDVAMTGLVVGILAFETARTIRDKVHALRGG
jgi:hypothetical protein